MAQPDFPQHKLTNGEMQLQVYLPDTEEGFYRSTRFDWSGVIGSLKYDGHQFIDHWLPAHDPNNNESITGPVEAFAPIGYEDANPGDPFYIIGVGTLVRSDTTAYHFASPYQIKDHGSWKVKTKKREIIFDHHLNGKSINYQYRKVVKIDKKAPKFTLIHFLKNQGSSPIETTVYNHNFFIIDGELTGPNIRTHFPYPIQADGRGFGDLIVAQDSSLIFTREFTKGESIYTGGIQGHRGISDDYHINIENLNSRTGIKITANRPMHKLAYWACRTTACPEPFIEIKIEPGKTFTWAIEYELYELPK